MSKNCSGAIRIAVSGLVMGAVAACSSNVPEAAEPEAEFTLQPIRYPEIESNDIYGPGCRFRLDNGGLSALAMTRAEDAFIRVDGTVFPLGVDLTSEKAPLGTREIYRGQQYQMALDLTGEEMASGGGRTEYTATLRITDAENSLLYEQPGIAQCGV